MRKFIISFLIVVVVVTAGATLYTFYIAFEHHFDIKRGSLNYYLLIPSFIREFPIVDPASEPYYISTFRDGMSAGENGVGYTTDLNIDELRRRLPNKLENLDVYIDANQIVIGEDIDLGRQTIPTILKIQHSGDGKLEIRVSEYY